MSVAEANQAVGPVTAARAGRRWTCAPGGADPPGQVYTPPGLAEWLVRETWRSRQAEPIEATGRAVTVYDPAMGAGALLLAARRVLAQEGIPFRLFGMDLGAEAVERARGVVAGELVAGNALLEPHPGAGTFDVIVANPPYLGARQVAALSYGAALLRRFGRRTDLYAYFLLRILEQLRPGGVAGVLLPAGWTTLAGYDWLRLRLLELDLRLVALLPSSVFACRVHPCALVVRNRPRDEGGSFDLRDLRRAKRLDSAAARAASVRLAHQEVRGYPRAMIAVPSAAQARVHAVHGRRLARWLRRGRRLQPEAFRLREGRLVPLASVLRVRDCGIHTRNCRHRLIYRSRCHPRLERLVRGRNVSAYQVRWAPAAGMGLYVDVHYKPQPGVPGRGRGGGQSRRGEYWDWQGPASIHLQPRRILIRQTDDDLVAGLIERPPRRTYTDNTLFTGLLTAGAERAGLTYEYLLGYLNAGAVNDVFQYLSQERGRAQAQVKIGQVRWLPLRIPSPEAVRRVTREVRRVLEALEQGDGSGADRYRRRIDRHFADAVMSPVR